MKKIYLTFDIETIVSGISKNDNVLCGVYLASMFIAEELRKRNLKGTFYISLSSKQDSLDQTDYLEFLKWLIHSLKSYDNIKLEPHIHAYRLPVGFKCEKDAFNQYNFEEQLELLLFAKSFFASQGVNISSFRPGSFSVNDSYYRALEEANIQFSSILNKTEAVNIDLINGKCKENGVYSIGNITEYPVSSVRVKSIKGKVEVINLSPDFLTLDSVKKYIDELHYININFHSFSVYLNRLIRENHKGLIKENIKFLLFENFLNRALGYTSIQTFKTKTIMSKELLRWLDYIRENNYSTYFIGE